MPLPQSVGSQAGLLGLKVIFGHHGNDGNGQSGTVSADQFQANSVTLAKTFAGNAPVIGCDLANEPVVNGAGQGGTLLSFNGAATGIDLRNMADPSQVNIAWH